MNQQQTSWHEQYSVGNAILDDQHKKLFALCSRARGLVDANSADRVDSEVHDVIYQLCQYTELHFRAEEEFMEMCGYPKTQEHKVEHTKFLETANELTFATMQGRLAPNQLLETIEDWINNHLIGSDLEYARHFEKLSRA